MAKYGMPYQGSKSRLAEEIIGILPAGGVLYDVFAGGCAITHAAIVSKKWDKVICNDICGTPKEFIDVIGGKAKSMHRWIGRENFENCGTLERIIWSFSNGQKAYLYSKENEPIKHLFWDLIHQWKIPQLNLRKVIKKHSDNLKDFLIDAACARFSADITPAEITRDYAELCEQARQYLNRAKADAGIRSSDVDRLLGNYMSGHYFGKSQWEMPTDDNLAKMQEVMPMLKSAEFLEIVRKFKACDLVVKCKELKSLDRVEALERIERLEKANRLQDLQSLKSMERNVEPHAVDYQSLDISRAGVIYCDPPYRGAEGYKGEIFNHADFWKWAESAAKSHQIYVSEITAPDGWKPIWQKKIKNLMGDNKQDRIEKLFVFGGS